MQGAFPLQGAIKKNAHGKKTPREYARKKSAATARRDFVAAPSLEWRLISRGSKKTCGARFHPDVFVIAA